MKYSLANNNWGIEEINAAKAVLDSQQCTMGKLVSEFEEKFAKSVGSKYAIMSNSGSSANLLAVSALLYRKNGVKLQKGDEVLVPAISWSTTYYPIHQNGLSMRFVDIDLNTLNIDENKLERAITPKTKALFAVNLLGNPNNFNKIKEICKKYNLLLLIDNCESQASTYNGLESGSLGDLGTYSFFFSHMMNSIEGGMTVTNDNELAQILLSLRAHGWLRQLPDENLICNKSGDHFEDSFKFVLPGYNLRPSEINAAIALEQLKKMDKFITDRRTNYKTFISELNKRNLQKYLKTQLPTENSNPSWFGFSIILQDKLEGNRKIVTQKLLEANIDCRPIVAGSFVKNPVIKYMEYSISENLNNAEIVDKNGLFIGNNPGDLTLEINYFFDTIEKIIKDIP